MNVEVKRLSDGTIEIKDNKGNITKRKIMESDFEQTLILENKIEFLNNKIDEFQNEIENNSKIDECDFVKHKSKFVLLIAILIIGSFGGLLIGTINYLSNLLIGGLIGLLTSFAIVATSIIIKKNKFKMHAKKMKGLKFDLNIAKELKKRYEQELTNKKENKIIYINNLTPINKVIYLEKQTNHEVNEINNALNDYYDVITKNPKKRVLKRK